MASGERTDWYPWMSDQGKNIGKIFKDRLILKYFDDAGIIANRLPTHELAGIGAKQYYKFLRDDPLHAAAIAKVCRMDDKMTDAANRWLDKALKNGVKKGTALIAKTYGASDTRVYRTAMAESVQEFKKGNWWYAIDMLKPFGLDPKVVLKDVADEGFEKAAKEGNALVVRYIAQILDLKCGRAVEVPLRN